MPRKEPKWGHLQLMQFIRLLRIHPELWDTSIAEYKDFTLRDKALEEIAFKMKTNADRIRRKIHTMRSQYTKECRKMKEDSSYQPKWKFFNEFRFIFKHKEPGIDDPLNDPDYQMKNDSDEDDDDDGHFNDDLSAEHTLMGSDDEIQTTTYIKNEVDCFENSEFIDEVDVVSNSPAKKRKYSKTTTTTSPAVIKKNIEENIATDGIEIVEDDRDEFAIFGDNIANELRMLKEYRSIQLALKCKIIRAVLEANEALHRVGWIK